MHRHRARFGLLCVLLWSAQWAALHAQETGRVLADFNGDGGIFKGAAASESVEALGGKAAKIDQQTGLKTETPGLDWNAFTHLSFEVFNPNEIPVRLHLCLKDGDAPHSYYSWINRYVSVAPGKHTVEFQISALRRGEGSPKDSLDPRPFKWEQMAFAMLSGGEKPVFVGAWKLSKIEMKTFPELKAFDFGPKATGVVFLGFTEGTPETLYTQERGFGWVGRAPAYARHRAKPPDELVGDWIADENATFQMDLPNGDYEGWAIMEDPGEWEFYQNFTQRSLTVNGQTIIDEKMTGKDFLDRYFHFAEVEDHPHDNVWERYIAWRYPQRTFNFTVTAGKAEFNLRGNSQYAATWNTLAVWPKAKAAEAKTFIEDVNQRRRQHHEKSWTELAPKQPALDPALAAQYQAQGYVPFQRSRDLDIGYFAAPANAGETKIELKAAGAWGQGEPLQFAIHALRDVQGLAVKTGAFTSDTGNELPASAFRGGFVNFKFKRIGFGGQGQFGVLPFIVKPFTATGPDTGTSALQGTARQFWITVTVPDGQKAGTYTGSFTLSAQGAPDLVLPASVTVLPFKLPEADMGLGLYGEGTVPYSAYGFPENQARVDADYERVIADLRAHGITLFDAGNLRFKGFKDGQAVWDTENAEKLTRAARAAGFPFLRMMAWADGRLNEIAQDPAAAAKKYGFSDGDAILKATYGTANEVCKQRSLPEPIFSFGDEPGTKPEIDKLLNMYGNIRKAGAHGEIAYSSAELTRPLLDVLRVSSLNHALLADIQRAQKAGNHVWLNNQGRNRWAYGVYMWKAHAAGIEAYQQFLYNSAHVDPYYPLDSIEDEESMVYPDREGALRPRVEWERIRQGTNDYRTLLLLKTLCEKAGAKGETVWAPVAKILDGLRFEDTAKDRRSQLTDAQLDELRALAVSGIISLTK